MCLLAHHQRETHHDAGQGDQPADAVGTILFGLADWGLRAFSFSRFTCFWTLLPVGAYASRRSASF
jgi:hypothetical protein